MTKIEEPKMTVTVEQIKAAMNIARAIAEAIREAGPEGLPSGPLYSMVSGHVGIEGYTKIIEMLKTPSEKHPVPMVIEKHHRLYWNLPLEPNK